MFIWFKKGFSFNDKIKNTKFILLSLQLEDISESIYGIVSYIIMVNIFK